MYYQKGLEWVSSITEEHACSPAASYRDRPQQLTSRLQKENPVIYPSSCHSISIWNTFREVSAGINLKRKHEAQTTCDFYDHVKWNIYIYGIVLNQAYNVDRNLY